MIIDFHVHAFPNEVAVNAIPVLSKTADSQAFTDGTLAGVKSSMDTAGINKSCILSIATKPSQTEKITDWCTSVADDSFIMFGSIHPDYTSFQKEIKRMKELGIKGVKFHPDYQGFFVDDEKLYPIYDALATNDMIIVFHAGVDIGLPKPYHCTPDRLLKVINRYPSSKIVAAHLGGYSYWDDVEKYLVGTKCYLDTSYTIGYIDNSRFISIVRNHGIDNVLFATDSPWKNQSTEIEYIKDMGFNEKELESIFYKNAEKLLNEI